MTHLTFQLHLNMFLFIILQYLMLKLFSIVILIYFSVWFVLQNGKAQKAW